MSLRKVAPLDGVENLVRLFQGVFANRVEGLFAVPRASAGGAQPRHDSHRLLEKGRCPRRIDGLCETTAPPERELPGGLTVACHLELGATRH